MYLCVDICPVRSNDKDTERKVLSGIRDFGSEDKAVYGGFGNSCILFGSTTLALASKKWEYEKERDPDLC